MQPSLQQSFLKQIKGKVSPNISFVDELADVLKISRDSAYRRIRGETTITLDEIQLLVDHFGISVDHLLNNQNNQITFNYRCIDLHNFTFEMYLRSILENLETISQFEVKELVYCAKDVPIFHYFSFPLLARFKIFFWLKTFVQDPDYAGKNFHHDAVPSGLVELGLKTWNRYINLPSIEIWSNETINITIRQIEFYWESGIFQSKEDAIQVCNEMMQMIDHIHREAEMGTKFLVDQEPKGSPNFKLYYNEIAIADNTIFFKMGDTMVTYVVHNLLNILTTTNVIYCQNTNDTINNVIKKSLLISSISEKERNKFFRSMRQKLEELNQRITA